MNLLVLGASGGCGRWVTRLALQRKHWVTALIRATASFDGAPGVRVVRGDALDPGVIDAALAGADAVINCIGIRRANPRNPWSKVVSPIDLTARVAANLSQVMSRRGVRRLIAISAAGVAESEPQMSIVFRKLFAASNVGVSYRDLAAMEQTLRSSELDWQAARPATLTNGRLTGRARVIDCYGLTSRISRADVASWILDSLETPPPFTDRTPMIATRRFY